MWKIYKDFNNHFTIGEDELEKAVFSFITGKPVVFKSGAALRHIESIMPDYHATMGWNEGYKLGADDFAYIRSNGVDRKLSKKYEEITTKVQYLIETKQEHMIGKNINIPELSAKTDERHKLLSEDIARLASKKRMEA